MGFVQTGSEIIETEAQYTAKAWRWEGACCVWKAVEKPTWLWSRASGQELESVEGQAKELGLDPVGTGNTDCP